MSETTTGNTPLKRSIDDLDLFDLPMVGIFKDKRYTAYTLSTLAGIEVENLDEMDVAARALNYSGRLITDFPKGLKKIPETKSTVIFICNFDPFENTPFSGKTRMRYTLRSDDDEMKFHTLSGMPHPFDGLTIMTIIIIMEHRIGRRIHPKARKRPKSRSTWRI